MKRILKNTLRISLGIVLILIMGGSSVAAFKNVKEGEDAPKFSINEMDAEQPVSLESYFEKNKVIIVTFWATWSPRSQKELEDLNNLFQDYKDKGFDVIAVNVEKEEPTQEEYATMKELKSSLKINYKLLLDTGLNVFNDYGVVAVPSTIILDGKGTIKKIYDGYPSSALLDMKYDVEIMLGLREPEKVAEVKVAEGPQIVQAAKLRYGLARKLLDRGMGVKAIPELENAAKLDEKYDTPLVLLGEVYESEANRVTSKEKKEINLTKAVEAFDRALKRNDKNIFAYCGLVRTYARLGKIEAADEAMKNIVKLDSNFITGIIANGMLLQAKGNDEEAIKEFQRALESNPNMPNIHYLIAKSYEKLKNYDKSIISLKESFKQLSTSMQLKMSQEKEK